MLKQIPTKRNNRKVFRLASIPFDDKQEFMQLMREFQMDRQGIHELRDYPGKDAYVENLEEILDDPFRPKRRHRFPTRFSDGSFPVFYSSLDAATAEAEVRHWLPKYIGKSKTTRKVYYQQFSCTFDGEEKDLRPQVDDWPDLVNDSDYTFCNRIGAEAKEIKLDGIVTESVRHNDGVNVPIFSRHAVSGPKLEALLFMIYDPGTDHIIVQYVDT